MFEHPTGFLPAEIFIGLIIISAIAGASIAYILFKGSFVRKISLDSLKQIAVNNGGKIIVEGEESQWIKDLMRKVLKTYPRQWIMFPAVLLREGGSGEIHAGYMEVKRTVEEEELVKRFSFFAFQGKWDIRGRINIRPKHRSLAGETFESAGFDIITGNESIPGFEDRFEVASSYGDSARELLGPDLQEVLMNSWSDFPFNSHAKEMVILHIERETLLLMGEMAASGSELESLYKTGNHISEILRAILENE